MLVFRGGKLAEVGDGDRFVLDGYDWKSAVSSGVDPVSPKFAAMSRRVLANRTCGHIVFVDNVAAHRWVVQTLVKAGVPEKRIAVLNAATAKASADRQRIAREFNGDPEDGVRRSTTS